MRENRVHGLVGRRRAAEVGGAQAVVEGIQDRLLDARGLGREDEAARVEQAVLMALDDGLRTADLGGSATTDEAVDAVLAHL